MTKRDRLVLIMCIVGSAFLWVTQKLKNEYRFNQRYDIKYILPDGRSFKSQPPLSLDVAIRGSGWDLLSKSAKNIGNQIEVELREDNNQVIPSNVIIENINERLNSKEISVANVIPKVIEVQLANQSIKKVPVISRVNIDFMPGYFYEDPMRFEPDSVILTGSRASLAHVHNWPTKTVYVNNLRSSIISMPIDLEPSTSNLVRLNVDQVKLHLPVEEFTEKEFTIPITVKNNESNVTTLPNTIKVKCSLGLSKYEILQAKDIEVYINMDESLISSHSNYAPVAISRLPSYVRSVELEPHAVRYFKVN